MKTLKFRRNDHDHNLLIAVGRWVKANGGNVVVAGGIGIMDGSKHHFEVCVSCLGTPPIKKEKK